MLGTNPTPTNIASGLSTIEEKSLGSVAKSGQPPYRRACSNTPLGRPRGPGSGSWTRRPYAPESLTGFVAAGAQLAAVLHRCRQQLHEPAVAPTIKLSANPATCARIGQQLDFDAHTGAFTGQAAATEDLADALEALTSWSRSPLARSAGARSSARATRSISPFWSGPVSGCVAPRATPVATPQGFDDYPAVAPGGQRRDGAARRCPRARRCGCFAGTEPLEVDCRRNQAIPFRLTRSALAPIPRRRAGDETRLTRSGSASAAIGRRARMCTFINLQKAAAGAAR